MVCNSLSQFLVTFSLREAFFASKYVSTFDSRISKVNLDNLVSAFSEQGYEVRLLWQGKYATDVIFEEEYKICRSNYFYSVEDTILIWNNNGCSSNYKNADKLLSSIMGIPDRNFREEDNHGHNIRPF